MQDQIVKLLCMVLCVVPPLFAQTIKPAAKPPNSVQAEKPAAESAAKPDAKPDARPANKDDDGRLALARKALAGLDDLVVDFKQLETLSNGLPLVRTLVKHLAPTQPERCRELLEKLFDTAERQAERDEAKLKAGGASEHQSNFRTLISMAASFDAEFARKLLDRFNENKKLVPVMDKSESGYFLAKELLNTDLQRAAAVANTLASEAFTTRALEFIGGLRAKNPQLAKAYLNTLLLQLAARRYPSINELFLLHSYVFLSNKLPIYVPEAGRLAFRQNVDYGKSFDGLTVDAELAKRYLQFGLKLLLEQERYLDGQAWDKADPRGDLLLLDYALLPGAQQYLPEAVEPLTQRRGVLLGFLDPAAQAAAQKSVAAVAEAKQNQPNDGDLLKQAEESKDPERKDQLYYQAAQRALKEHDYADALALVEKMSARNSRTAREFVSYEIALLELGDGKVEEARRRFADDSDLARKAYGLSQLALVYLEGKNKDLSRAADTLNEVASLAAKLDPGVEQTLVLAGSAAVYARYDGVRALETFRAFVAAANKAEKFDGGNFLSRFLKLNNFYYGHYLYRDKLLTAEVYARLARNYFDVLLLEAKSLNHPLAKAAAVVTLCQSVLAPSS